MGNWQICRAGPERQRLSLSDEQGKSPFTKMRNFLSSCNCQLRNGQNLGGFFPSSQENQTRPAQESNPQFGISPLDKISEKYPGLASTVVSLKEHIGKTNFTEVLELSLLTLLRHILSINAYLQQKKQSFLPESTSTVQLVALLSYLHSFGVTPTQSESPEAVLHKFAQQLRQKLETAGSAFQTANTEDTKALLKLLDKAKNQASIFEGYCESLSRPAA